MKTLTVLQYILYALEIVSCAAGFICWKKIRGTYLKWFPLYLLFIVLAELAGNYLNYSAQYLIKRNLFNYLIVPAEFLFFYWLYYKAATSTRAKKFVIIVSLMYALGFILDQFYFSQREFYFVSFSYCVGNLSLLLAIISFFIQFAKSSQIVHFRSSLLFWVSFGLLIFYLGTLPYFGLLWLLFKEYRTVFNAYTNIMFVCNWIMYTLFTIGFIWTKKN